VQQAKPALSMAPIFEFTRLAPIQRAGLTLKPWEKPNGRNTKLMLMVDLKGRPVALLLVPGQAYEGHHVVGLLTAAGLPPGLTIVGDKAYDDDKLRYQLTELGYKTCFPTKSNRKESRPMHKGQYRKRYRVENCFCRLKRWASVATRRDKLASRFLSLVTFAAIIDWLT
jgi:transposase